MNKLNLLVTLLLCPFLLSAQPLDMDAVANLKIRSIGPAGMSGRVTTIDVDHDRPERIFIGTASGGVWKSENGGVKWEPIFDNQPVASIGAIALNQNNTDEIWVGTGEGNPRNSHTSGEGVYRSLDGGKSWQLMGLENTRLIHRIIIHPTQPNTVYVGALGSAWGPTKDRGVYKTTDGGKNWKKVLYINEETGVADMVQDPLNPNKIVVAMWEFGRKPWTFNSGGEGSGLYITFDGGETWQERTAKDGLPKGKLGRMGLAIAANKPNIIYALVEAKKNGLYKSTDGGFKWKKIADKNIGNRPFYYADIYVDPQNENRIFNLWSVVSKSEDGGKTFDIILPFRPYSGVHPDHHAFWVHPVRSNYMIEGYDGGLNISYDGGNTWRFVDNLPLAQFYHINYDMDIPYNVYGGMQDNGSWVGPAYNWQHGGIRNHEWQELYFGDGFDVVPKPNNSRYVYAMSQGGNVNFIDRETGYNRYCQPVHPDGDRLRFHWNAAIAQDPFNDCGVYFGSQYVHYSADCGENWTLFSPDLTTNDTTKQKQHLSGGLTIDDTEAENHTTIIAIAPSPHNENTVWVGTDDGNLQLTRDGGKTWSNHAAKLSGVKSGAWIPQIVVSPHQAGEAFVIVNDYRRNDWRPMAFHTADYGATWHRIVNENKVQGHALSIVQDPVEENLLFLGTEYGLFVSIDKGKNWRKWEKDFPAAPVRDLKIHPREHDLIIGTFGRAAYILDDLRPLREIARNRGKVLNKAFKVFEAPDAYMASYRAVDGLRFTADGHFIGENRRRGAMITLWVGDYEMVKTATPEADNRKKRKKGKAAATIEEPASEQPPRPKKVKAIVLDMQGDTIRHFSAKVDTGMNRIYWGFNQDGAMWPTSGEPKEDADPPSGFRVLPGDYKLVFTYGDFADSTKVTVKADPRLDLDVRKMALKHEALTEVQTITKAANKAYLALLETEKTIKLVNDAFVHAPDSIKTSFKEMGNALKDSIAMMKKLYTEPSGLKGLRRSPDNINANLWKTNNYIYASDAAPSTSAQVMIDKYRRKVTEAIDTINRFLKHDWQSYQEKVEAARTSLFKEIPPIKLE